MARITIDTRWFDSLDTLPVEIKQQVYYAVVMYLNDGTVVDMDTSCSIAFCMVRKEIDKALSLSEKRKKAGSKGGQKSMNLLKQNSTDENFAQANNDFGRAKQEFAQAKVDYAQANDIDPWKETKEDVLPLSPVPSIITPQENTVENHLKEKTPKGVKEKAPKRNFAEDVRLTDSEYEKLVLKHGIEATQWMIDKLNAFKLSKGKVYKSDYGAINNWVVERYEDYKNKQQTKQPQSAMDIYYEAAAKIARGELL